MANNYRSPILRLNHRNRGLKPVPPVPILGDASAISGKTFIRGKPVGHLQISRSWAYGEDRATNERALRVLAAELARAREQERQRIANDLHDNIAQNLAL